MAEETTGMVSVLDEEVLADAAAALGGAWRPADEADPDRRDRLLSCARLLLYSSRRGLRLMATAEARASVSGAQWVLATVEDLADLGDETSAADIEGLADLYVDDALPPDAARQLATCVLDDRVRCLIANAKKSLRHGRDGDLPERLLLLEPEAAVAQLDLATGEQPSALPPALAGETTSWWVPS